MTEVPSAAPDRDAVASAIAAVEQVLEWDPPSGSPGGVRADTPLSVLGVDSLARLLIVDACAESGWLLAEDAAWSAEDVRGLVAGARPRPGSS